MDLKAIRVVPGAKSSHDWNGSEEKSKLFSYFDLWKRKIPAVGIPAKPNGLVIIDVDAASTGGHKKDGREWWIQFAEKEGIPPTYTVTTPSGGWHMYFKLPPSINPQGFQPPKELAPGVDIIWSGWVSAPPTPDYNVVGNMTIADIQVVPPTLFAEIEKVRQTATTRQFDSGGVITQHFHTRFTPEQLRELELHLQWVQTNGSPSYAEWRDGLFALRAGIDDEELLEKFVHMWSMNQSYMPGDEEKGMQIAHMSDPHGPVGPGTIFAIVKEMKMRASAPTSVTALTVNDIFAKANVDLDFDKKGQIKVTCNETNVFGLLNVIIPPEDLYLDTRTDLAMYKGRSVGDDILLNTALPMLQSTHAGLGLQNFKASVVKQGIELLLHRRRHDPHAEMVATAVWDGVPRVENFWTTYCGVDQSPYVQRVAKNFWVALAARAMNPGCKFDNMVIIEGWEGLKKSTLLKAIAGNYIYEVGNRKAFQDVDDLRKMHQSVITELPELIGLQGEEGNVVKNFLARPVDVVRDLFVKRPSQRRRSFVCVGTTNAYKYLDHDMGSRRYWPIFIKRSEQGIDIDAVVRDRQQLFAEARELFNMGYEFWFMPDDLLTPVVQLRVVHDPMASVARDCLASGHSVRALDVFKIAQQLQIVGNVLDRRALGRIMAALQAAGGVAFNEGGEEYFKRVDVSLDNFV